MAETIGSNYLRDFFERISEDYIAACTDPDIQDLMLKGEQPDSSALPTDGALRGEVPLSGAERSEA